MRTALGTALLAAGLWLAAASPAAGASPTPWRAADDARLALSEAEAELVLGEPAVAAARVEQARVAVESLLASRPAERRLVRAALADAAAAAAAGDEPGLAAGRARAWTAVLAASFAEATRAAARGDVADARGWLLVREFRPPTRFTRAAADATLALDGLAAGRVSPAAAARAVRADLLDTYDGRLRSVLSTLREAQSLGFATSRAEAGALALGYWRLLAPAYRAQRGVAAARRTEATLAALAAATVDRSRRAGETSTLLGRTERELEGFRAAPLSAEEQLRRAGQLERFLRLVPIEYGRGVSDGRVRLDFEVQEAITFRDGAAGAFGDLESLLLRSDRTATRELDTSLVELGDALTAASRGTAVADPQAVQATTDRALRQIDLLYPNQWKDAAQTADFDVISAALDRLEGAVAAGEWGRAEQARLEAYGVFELGPEQRLRGLASSLFRDVEGFFWYGAEGKDGLVQLLKRKADPSEIAATRQALDGALGESERRIGSGSQSAAQIVTNSAIIVFREGLEAVLILAALMASLVGAQRRYRRPLLAGVGVALLASMVTWVVAQTILTELAGYGERLEAIVSLVAIAVLLLILNWFYHRVYWQQNLQELHGRKKRVLAGAGISLAAAQVVGLVMLGFTSVYREGFETVIFLQAMTLEAGAWTVLQGVALGFRGRARGLLPRRRPGAQAAAQEDADRDGAPDHLGARRDGRDHGADPAEGGLGARDTDRRARAAVLGRAVARLLSDLAGRARPDRGRSLRRGELRGRRVVARAPARPPPRAGLTVGGRAGRPAQPRIDRPQLAGPRARPRPGDGEQARGPYWDRKDLACRVARLQLAHTNARRARRGPRRSSDLPAAKTGGRAFTELMDRRTPAAAEQPQVLCMSIRLNLK